MHPSTRNSARRTKIEGVRRHRVGHHNISEQIEPQQQLWRGGGYLKKVGQPGKTPQLWHPLPDESSIGVELEGCVDRRDDRLCAVHVRTNPGIVLPSVPLDRIVVI